MTSADRERRPVKFSKWTPVKRDTYVGYSYTVDGPRGERTVTPGVDRWHRAKFRIASSVLAMGVDRVRVWGGLGDRSWARDVLATQEEAEKYLREAAARSFMLRGTLRKALAARDRRIAAEIAAEIQQWADENIVGRSMVGEATLPRFVDEINRRINIGLAGTGLVGHVVNPRFSDDHTTILTDGVTITRDK